ncbi:glycerophosphodiester phosphodiesterase [Terrimesophilobacter mesophilus]|uniref:glycerophosphodiester phosphodiesterase n=1 Tax=Terrimesophilobacter mesophilus TaxID=433647 RepID=UPI001E409189|nr:glycerophosphodiester phosphodiesterase [Terrimesophilobacter mesophilus]
MNTARNGASGGGYLHTPPPRVLAHRGLATEAPENTLLAFAKALAVGVTHIETDVHESSDGVAVISHDDTLDRIAGRAVRVDQLTSVELRRVDLGAGQGFATLSEAIDAFPDARFNIDIKSAGAVEPTIAAIRSLNAIDRVLVTSFSDARRRAAVKGLPGVATSASFGTMAKVLLASRLRWRRRARALLASVDAVQLPERWKGVQVVTPPLIRMARAAGTEVHVWTINEPDDMVRLLDLGVDGIVTDRADLAIDIVRSRR